mgnify:CR=1 FL=1
MATFLRGRRHSPIARLGMTVGVLLLLLVLGVGETGQEEEGGRVVGTVCQVAEEVGPVVGGQVQEVVGSARLRLLLQRGTGLVAATAATEAGRAAVAGAVVGVAAAAVLV